jgi:hypothetical protein
MNPAMDTNIFPSTGAEYWWTSEVRSNDAGRIWVTNSGGGIGAHLKTETKSAGGTKKIHVRVVRNTSTPMSEVHYTDNGNGTIIDHFTGLMWQKIPSNDTISWEKALQYAENLSLAGFTDWRLPNIKELNSINDELKNAPSINSNFFTGVKSGRYWSSTTQKGQPINAWFIDFQNFGITSYFSKSKGYYTMCVRSTAKTNSSSSLSMMEKLKIFPNPASSMVHLSWENDEFVNIKIYSAQGSIVAEHAFSGISSDLDVSNLVTGLYIFCVSNSKGNLIGKGLFTRQ